MVLQTKKNKNERENYKKKMKNNCSRKIEAQLKKIVLTSGRAWLPLNGSTRQEEGTS
jgi:hypothetical protein